jgi:hypothetical protein
MFDFDILIVVKVRQAVSFFIVNNGGSRFFHSTGTCLEHYHLTNSMELSTTGEATSCEVTR